MLNKDMTCIQCGTRQNTRFIEECQFALCKNDAKGTDYDFDKPKQSYKLDDKAVEKEFNKYKSPNGTTITLNEIPTLAEAVGCNLEEDVFMPYMMFKSGCKKFEIGLQEFKNCLRWFKVPNVAGIKGCVKNVLTNTLATIDTKEFTDFYHYIFNLFCPRKGGNLSFDYVTGYFRILFGKYKLTEEFITFVEGLSTHKVLKDMKGVTNDQWQNFRRLLVDIGDNFPTGYEYVSGAWPGLFDHFYEFFCDKRGIKYEKAETIY